jgi:hypothetical protein
VNAFDFKNVGDMITYIKHLDSPEGKKEYIDMLTQPAFYDNIPNEFLDLARFLDWWDQFVYEV